MLKEFGLFFLISIVFIRFQLLDQLFSTLLVNYKPETKGIVLISGASTGIGKSAAYELVKNGFHVLVGVRKMDDFKKVKESFVGNNEQRENLHSLLLDVTDPIHCENAIKQAIDLSKSLNLEFVALVNNAGSSGTISPLEWTSEKSLRSLFEINFFGATRLTSLVLPYFRQRKSGRIITVSSVAGKIALPLGTEYSSSKFAVNGFFDSLRREVEQFGISVSVLDPGCVKSALTLEKVRYQMEALISKNKTDEKYKDLIFQAVAFENTCGAYGYDPETSTSKDILHAITSAHPLTHYVNGNFLGAFHVSTFLFNFWLLPDRVIDAIIRSPIVPLGLKAIFGDAIGTLA